MLVSTVALMVAGLGPAPARAAEPAEAVGLFGGAAACEVTVGPRSAVSGAVHSEGDLRVRARSTHTDGSVTVVGTAEVHRTASSWQPTHVPAADPVVFPGGLSGAAAEAAARAGATHTHPNGLTVDSEGTVPSGLHYVTGDVVLGHDVTGTGVQIVATGTITAGHRLRLTGPPNQPVLVSLAATGCAPAVALGHEADLGPVFAPHGGITVGVRARVSSLIGAAVSVETAGTVTGSVPVPLDQAPTLVSSTPVDGASGQGTATAVALTFSEAVSAQPGALTLACDDSLQDVTVTGLPGDTATLTPVSALPADATCTVTITGSGISDVDASDPPDTMATDATITFTTDAAPTVTATVPAADATGIATGTDLTVTFSEPVEVTVDSFTLTCAGTAVPFSVDGSGTATVVLTPSAALPATTRCALTVNAAQVHDSDAGDPPDTMDADVHLAFTTVDAAPTVVTVAPADGTTEVSAATTLQVTFSEPVTVTPGAFVLSCAGTTVAMTVSSGPAAAYTLTPGTLLPKATTCTLTVVAAEVADVDGVAPANPPADHVSSFDVAANAAPTDLTLTPATVAENAPAGTVVGTLSTTDPDAGESFTYTLVSGAGDTDNALFGIDGATLVTNGPLDADTAATHTVRVRSTDSGGESIEKSFVITVTDVNEAPSAPVLTGTEIAEDQPGGVLVGTLSATDPEGGTLTFTLVTDGCGGTFPAGDDFTITGNELRSGVRFDYETAPSHEICVRVTDSGSPALSTDAAFTITVTDVDEAPSAVDDHYTGAIGNTLATLGQTATGPRVELTGASLLANDSDAEGDALSVVPETVTTTGGGTATLQADGSFTYLPGVGDVAQDDTFAYRVSDGDGTAAGTVTITIGPEIVWYIDSNAPAAGADGRSTSPFPSLGPVNGSGDADGPGHHLALSTGAGPYRGGLVLEANQHLVGEREPLIVGGTTLRAAGTSTPTITNAGGNGLVLADGVDVRGIAVDAASADGLHGTDITTATVGTATVPVPVSGSGGDGLELTGGAGTIALHTPITTSGGRSVAISGRTGGEVNLTQEVTGRGVELADNTGAAIAFSGPLTITTTTTPAFSATGGGTVTATDPSSTLSSTTGTALRVDATSIGAADLAFRAVSANGADHGIRLDNTGNAGGLRVLGGGSTAQGGDGSGGTITATTGAGVLLNNTRDVQLNNLTIQDVATSAGLHGAGVVGFRFTNGRIDGSGQGPATPDPAVANLAFNTPRDQANLTGSVTVTNSVLRNAAGDGLDISNAAGTISVLTVDGNLIESATDAASSDGSAVSVRAIGSSGAAAAIGRGTISDNTIRNFPSESGITLYGGNSTGAASPAATFGSTATPVVVRGNSIRGQSTTNTLGENCILLQMDGLGSGAVDILDNGTTALPLADVTGTCVSLNATGSFVLNTRVTGNVLDGTGQVAGSHGIAGGADRDTNGSDSAVLNATVENNQVSAVPGPGIRFLANSRGALRVRIRENTVTTQPDSAAVGIRVDSGTSSSSAVDTTVCAQIEDNVAAGSTNPDIGTAPGIGLRKQGTDAALNEFGIVGLTPSPANRAETVAYVSGQNPDSTLGAGGYGTDRVFIASGDNFVGCTLP